MRGRVHNLAGMIVEHKANELVLCLVVTNAQAFYAHRLLQAIAKQIGYAARMSSHPALDVFTHVFPALVLRGSAPLLFCIGWLPLGAWLGGSLHMLPHWHLTLLGSCYTLI